MEENKTYKGGGQRGHEVGQGMYYCIPANALKRLARRYEYGAIKYSPENFKKGLPISNCIDHIFQHLVKYLEGDNSDDNMAAIAWGAFAIMYYEEFRPSFQDIAGRRKYKGKDFEYAMPIEKGDVFK